MNALLQQALAAREQLQDHTKEAPSFERRVIAEGWHVCRMVSYVEVGKRPQKAYQGKDKPPAYMVRIGFEMLSAKDAQEIEIDGETRTVYPVHYELLALKVGDKARFTRLFKKLAYGRDTLHGQPLTHMAQFLGDAFRIKFVHKTVKGKDGQQDRTYANCYSAETGWMIEPPVIEKFDENGDSLGKKRVKVDEPHIELSLLLWEAPTAEQWNSIFIDGSYVKKAKDGTEEEVSKNWLQEDIVNNALDYNGSALQMVVEGGAIDEDDELSLEEELDDEIPDHNNPGDGDEGRYEDDEGAVEEIEADGEDEVEEIEEEVEEAPAKKAPPKQQAKVQTKAKPSSNAKPKPRPNAGGSSNEVDDLLEEMGLND